MYAPLALTFVNRNRVFIRCLTYYFLRAPVLSIQVNATTTPSSSSKATSHTGVIAGGIAGGVAGLILLVGTIALVRRRRRPDDIRNHAGAFFRGTTEARPQMTVAPFNPTLGGAAPLELGSQIWTTSDRPSPMSEPSLLLTQSALPVPVGLSSKELARLRSTPILSPSTDAQLSSSGSEPVTPPTFSATERSTLTPTPETQRLQTEVESLRREMQQLQIRAERFEAPPSYGEGGGV